MEKIIAKLNFTQFSFESFENPDLQKHYKNLEALALDKDMPEDFVDTVLPNTSIMSKKAGSLIQQFIAETFPDGYDPEAPARKPAARKIKAEGDEGGAAVKRPKPDADPDLIKKLHAENKLGSLTVPELKAFASSVGLKGKTKKDDIIEQIKGYFTQ